MSEHGGETNLCQDCGVNQAVGTVAVMMGAKVIHRKLCQACMAKTSMAIAAGNMGQVLGSLMAAARASAPPNAAPQGTAAPTLPKAPPKPELPAVDGEPEACPDCGMPLAQLRKEGRLGCAACASAFRRTLLAALGVDGQACHAGRRPEADEMARRARAQRESLQRRLDEAIAREDYETAAQLRDALRQVDGRRAQHGA